MSGSYTTSGRGGNRGYPRLQSCCEYVDRGRKGETLSRPGRKLRILDVGFGDTTVEQGESHPDVVWGARPQVVSLDPIGGVSLFDVYGYGHGNKKTFDLIDPDKLYAADLNDPEGLLSRGVFFDEIPPEKNARLIQMWEEAQAGLE